MLPWLARREMPAIAYSPIDHMRLPKRTALDEIARERGVSPTRVALAWVLGQPNVLAIPKAGSVEHVRDNRAALDLVLGEEELARLDAQFKSPRGSGRLKCCSACGAAR